MRRIKATSTTDNQVIPYKKCKQGLCVPNYDKMSEDCRYFYDLGGGVGGDVWVHDDVPVTVTCNIPNSIDFIVSEE